MQGILSPAVHQHHAVQQGQPALVAAAAAAGLAVVGRWEAGCRGVEQQLPKLADHRPILWQD